MQDHQEARSPLAERQLGAPSVPPGAAGAATDAIEPGAKSPAKSEQRAYS